MRYSVLCGQIKTLRPSEDLYLFMANFNTHNLCVVISKKEDALIRGARSPWRLNFVRWRKIFVGSQYGFFLNVTLPAPGF